MPDKVILDPHGRRLDLVFSPEDLQRLYALADIVWGKDDPMPEAELAAVREDVVDFDALTELALAGRFKAAVDVYPEEPLPLDHPIRTAPNVILSSHRAGAIGEALRNIGRIVVNDVEAILAGLVPQEMQVAQPEFIRLRG